MVSGVGAVVGSVGALISESATAASASSVSTSVASTGNCLRFCLASSTDIAVMMFSLVFTVEFNCCHFDNLFLRLVSLIVICA